MSGICGIWGLPYVDLTPFIDTSSFAELDREISLGLCHVDPTYTGGSLKHMGVVAPWVQGDPFVDYARVILGFSRQEFLDFVNLGDDPERFDPEQRAQYAFGDETDHPLTRKQMAYLKYRYGVYFPWQVCYHFLENDRWEDKHSGAGKTFDEQALRVFPRTIEFIRSLPFVEVGRAVLFGLEANHHAPAHRDSEPGSSLEVAQSITFSPRGNKRFYLCDPKRQTHSVVNSRVYWFNDMDYHGVEPDPFFRYSVRVDGVFERDFVKRLRAGRRGSPL